MERSDAQIRLPHFCGLEEVAQHTRYDLAGTFIPPVKIRTRYEVQRGGVLCTVYSAHPHDTRR